MVNNKRIAKNTLFLYFRTFLIMLISLYTSRVVLDVLGETDFGIYNLVGGIVVLFTFMSSAMSAATQRYLNYELGRNNPHEVGCIFSMSLTVHFCIAFCVLVVGESLGLWFVMTQLNIPAERYDTALWVYQLSLLGCCFNILRIPYNACIIAYERMSFYAYASVFEAILRLGIVFLFPLTSADKLIAYALLTLVVIIAVNIVFRQYCRRNFSTSHYAIFWDKSLFNKLMSFSGWSMVGGLTTVGVGQGMNILLNIFYGVALNAAMGIAHQIHSAVQSFMSSFQVAFSPQIVKTYAAKQHEDFVQLICRSSRLSYCLVFIISPAIMVCIQPILKFWLTIVPEYTGAFSVIFIVYCMIDALSSPLWVSVQATGNIRTYQILMSLICFCNFPIMYIMLIMGCSPVHVVGVRLLVNILLHFARLIYIKKLIGFPVGYYLKNVMLKVFIMTIISIPLYMILTPDEGSLSDTALVFVSVVIQNLILSWFIGLSSNERKAVLQIIKNKNIPCLKFR